VSFGRALIAWILTITFGSILTITIVSSANQLFTTSDIGAAIIISILISSFYSIPAFVCLIVVNFLIKKPDGSITAKSQLLLFATHLFVSALTFIIIYYKHIMPEIIPIASIVYPFLGSFIWYRGIKNQQKREL